MNFQKCTKKVSEIKGIEAGKDNVQYQTALPQRTATQNTKQRPQIHSLLFKANSGN